MVTSSRLKSLINLINFNAKMRPISRISCLKLEK